MQTDTNGYNPASDIGMILDHYRPASVVHSAGIAEQCLQRWPERTTATQCLKLPPEEPESVFPLPQLFELALVTDTLEKLPQARGQKLLGQLRNMGATRIAVLVRNDSPWRFQDFIGMGFTRLYQYTEPVNATLFAYDLDTYNYVREWNNPDNWANPEMWDKARW
ncbi:DUF6231 family protein [Salicola sp. Rm-C-2C1-2]|uniref:DUF6231 family protein n=1 Tax=Salicola sp. Rm-C-2C1-2 TaxID=3141321 RepID=UPI0032E44C6F